MRGVRTAIAKQKIDLILVAVRYDSERRRMALAQGYARRGVVWGDLQLFDRADLIRRMEAGERVAAGRPAKLQGDFELFGRLRLNRPDGQRAVITQETGASEVDDLGLPLF